MWAAAGQQQTPVGDGCGTQAAPSSGHGGGEQALPLTRVVHVRSERVKAVDGYEHRLARRREVADHGGGNDHLCQGKPFWPSGNPAEHCGCNSSIRGAERGTRGIDRATRDRAMRRRRLKWEQAQPYTAPVAGRLFLGINQSLRDAAGATGSFQVKIEVLNRRVEHGRCQRGGWSGGNADAGDYARRCWIRSRGGLPIQNTVLEIW